MTTEPEYMSVKDAIKAGLRLPLKEYVFTMKMETDGYSVRAYRSFCRWVVEILADGHIPEDLPDGIPHGFYLSHYYEKTNQYALIRRFD